MANLSDHKRSRVDVSNNLSFLVMEDEIDKKRKEIRWKEYSSESKTFESASWGNDDNLPSIE